MPKHPEGDRNFDGLVQRFQRNIYQTLKGKTRLAVLQRDFDQHLLSPGASVLDVGAGEGRWASELASRGHRVTLVDVSEQMLEASRAWFAQQPWWPQYRHQIAWHQSSIHELHEVLNGSYDVVCCHALLEWLQEPSWGLRCLNEYVAPQGWLSVLFYNVDGLVYKNLLRGNFGKVRNADYRGFRGSLTPTSPLSINEITAQLTQLGYSIACVSGVRVFFDYILDPAARASLDPQDVIEMELLFSQRDPYRGLGRYVHILAQKL